MGIFSKKKKESPVVKGRAETSDEFAGRIVQELNSEANKSSASLPTSHNTVNDTQGTIIDILKQQSSDEKFFMAIIFSGVLAYVAFSLIVSIVTSVLLLSLALIFLTPLRLEETSSHQPESESLLVKDFKKGRNSFNNFSSLKKKACYTG